MIKRTLLGIHSRNGELLLVIFSTPFGPEVITFLDPDSAIEEKIKHLMANPHTSIIWDGSGIKIKRLGK